METLNQARGVAQDRITQLQRQICDYEDGTSALNERLRTELAATEARLWEEVEAVTAEANKEQVAVKVEILKLLKDLGDAVHHLGLIKARLMLMDQDLEAEGYRATNAHEAVELDGLILGPLKQAYVSLFSIGPDAVRREQHKCSA